MNIENGVLKIVVLFYRQLIDECNPKVIICTGVTEKDNFFKFFTGEAVYETKALKEF